MIEEIATLQGMELISMSVMMIYAIVTLWRELKTERAEHIKTLRQLAEKQASQSQTVN